MVPQISPSSARSAAARSHWVMGSCGVRSSRNRREAYMNLRVPKSVLIGTGVLLLVIVGLVLGVFTTTVLTDDEKPGPLTAATVTTGQTSTNAEPATSPSRPPAPTPVPTVTKTETQTPAYVPVPVPVAERTKYVPQPYPAVATGSWHSIVTLEGSNVFVRSGPSTGSAP